jgi:hypothetical protein
MDRTLMDIYVIIEWKRKGEQENVYATTSRDEAANLYIAINQTGNKATLWKASEPPALPFQTSLFSIMEDTTQ